MSTESIAITVTFLTGRYHGREWPPSPARLYQAMLAGVMTGGYREHLAKVEPALRWLERQEAPSIFAVTRRNTAPYRISVPNNDLDRAGLEWVAGREANPAQYRTMKTIEEACMEGGSPHLFYRWSADPSDISVWSDGLRQAAHSLHTFGWGVDMAFADLVVEAEPLAERFSPSEEGDRNLDVPMEGTFDDLQSTYRRFVARNLGIGVDTYTRPSMIDNRTYAMAGQRRGRVATFRLLDLDGETPKSVPWAHCMKVAGWLRHAAAGALGEIGWAKEEIASYVQGHTDGDENSRRLSYVPLPSIGGPFPDGRIRRVMIVEPASESGSAVHALRRAMNGRELTDENSKLVAYLSVAETGADSTLQNYVGGSSTSHVWRSVTPVILHGFNVQRKGAIDVNKTMKLLLRAFEMGGHAPDSIESLSFQAGPLWRGGGHASAMLTPQHLAKYPRVHVEVTFKQPVPGPVLAGIGRHYGIGVFARVR